LNVFIIYFTKFECIWMYLLYILLNLNVFECIYSIFQCISMCLKIFECIYWNCNWNFTIIFSLYCFFRVHPRTHLLFTIHNDYLPSMLYHYTLFSHFHWFVSTFIQSMKKLHINPYFSCLYITPHFISYIPHGTLHIPCCHWLCEA
jgi:hypothetical protein